MSGMVRADKLIANLGYGSRKDVAAMMRAGRITRTDGTGLSPDDRVAHDDVRVDGKALDPPQGLVLMLNKPPGYTASTVDPGRVVYELLPDRFVRRSPIVAPVGRLDRDTTGLLLMTDDGPLLHRITSPRTHLPKVYEVTLDRPLDGSEGAVFASGTLMLKGETTPLLPAALDVTGEKTCRLTITEGRYHQVRRMFAALGNHVTALHRSVIGGISLGGLPEGEWRYLERGEITAIFA